MKLGRPSLLGGPALSDTERRNSFDNILTQSSQVDGQNKREGKVRSVKRGRDGRMMMGGINKRSRSDPGVTPRQNVQVKIKHETIRLSHVSFILGQVENKEGGGRIFTIFPPWMESPNVTLQPPDLDKEMAESFG